MHLPEKVVPDEEWRPVNPDYVHGIVDDTYLVSNYGRVYNCKEERLLTPSACSNHLRVHLRIKDENGKSKDISKSLQRVMMTAFNPVEGFEDLEVDHIDNCSFNNQLQNLQWLTREENKQKEFNSVHGRSKLSRGKGLEYVDMCSDDAIRKVCELLTETRLTYDEISDITGVPKYTIKSIKNGHSFANIAKNYNFIDRRRSL